MASIALVEKVSSRTDFIRHFENDPGWHARKIKEEDLEIGRRELELP